MCRLESVDWLTGWLAGSMRPCFPPHLLQPQMWEPQQLLFQLCSPLLVELSGAPSNKPCGVQRARRPLFASGPTRRRSDSTDPLERA